MLPPQPQVSLPTPKYGKLQGLSRPFFRRSSASVDFVSDVMYSTHSAISCGLPGADVAGHIGVRADQLGEIEELVRAE